MNSIEGEREKVERQYPNVDSSSAVLKPPAKPLFKSLEGVE